MPFLYILPIFLVICRLLPGIVVFLPVALKSPAPNLFHVVFSFYKMVRYMCKFSDVVPVVVVCTVLDWVLLLLYFFLLILFFLLLFVLCWCSTSNSPGISCCIFCFSHFFLALSLSKCLFSLLLWHSSFSFGIF